MSLIEALLLALVLIQLLFVAPATSAAAGALKDIAGFYARYEKDEEEEEVADEQR